MAQPLRPAYLICGSDRPKVLRSIARLRARVAGEGGVEEVYDATDVTGEEVTGAAAQLGLFAADRLILVNAVEGWKADDVAAIASYLALPSPLTTLALVAGPSLRKDHKARTLVAGDALLSFDLPEGRALPAHLRKEAERVGARIDGDAIRLLIELVGENATALERELDKLATFAAGAPIDRGIVLALAFRGDDVSPFALADAVSNRDRRGAMRALVRSEDAGEKPHALLPQIARHVDLLRRARRSFDAGGDARSFAKDGGIHEFRARKLFEAASAWPQRDAAATAIRLARADHAMKGGIRIDPQLALERALRDSL